MIAALPLFAAAYGVLAGVLEGHTINERILAGDRRELDHRKLMHERLAIGTAAVLLTIAFDFRWAAIAYAPLYWSAFVMCHRFTLNATRNFHICYVSPGNGYDLWLLRRVTGWGAAILKDVHRAKYHANTGGYADMVHRAGAIMYISEASVLIASILILTLTNTN